MTDRYPAELNTVARLKIGVGGVVTSARRWLDLVAGTGVTLTPVDDGLNEKVTVTVAVTGAPPTGNAGGDLTGTYPNPTIGAGKVVTASILDANVTTAKLAANAVTSNELASNAVTTGKITDANVTLAKLAAEAWTAWTPTVTANSGTITTVGAVTARAAKIGRTVVFQISIAITTNGTGASALRFTLPYTPVASGAIGYGKDDTTGPGLTVTTNTSFAFIFKYDGTYPGADGHTYLCSGSYESTT